MSHTPRILIVDDDQFMRRMLGAMLAPLCPEVDAQSNALGAIAQLEQPNTRPDIIVLDLKMPDIDGVQFARMLSEKGFAGGVVLISGADDRVLQTTAALLKRQSIDVLGYFKKPVIAKELLALIAGWRPSAHSAQSAAPQALGLEEIRKGFDEREFFTVFQPKVDFANGRVAGYETLLRWQHPEYGVLAPDSFLSQLNQAEDLRRLTRYVIETAFSETSVWLKEPDTPGLALNVTMEDLQQADFPQTLSALVQAHQIPPDKITIEVTESSDIDASLRAIDSASSLRILGFSLSIDDFGTGHSTLSQLRDMPFNELKIDRGFVTNASVDSTRRSIFTTSVSLAKQLDMTVVAEGIESHSDWVFAHQAGCNYGQGYFISPPLHHDALLAWQEQWQERVKGLL